MVFRRSGNWLIHGLCLCVFAGLPIASVNAQTTFAPILSIDQLQEQAARFEFDGKWNDALQVWCKIYGQDRQNTEANKHIQNCLRRIFQAQRQIDRSLREKVLSLSHSQALALYGEVLTTLHGAYVDRSKVVPSRLFQQGLDEFLLSLNDANFRKQHLKGIRDKEISDFQTRLREFMTLRSIEDRGGRRDPRQADRRFGEARSPVEPY